MSQNDTEIPQQSKESSPHAARDGYGWIVTCPKRERNHLVMRKQIMDGSWQVCPFCGHGGHDDEPEAA